MGLQRLVDCDIWYSWWDGACCLLADPSSPSRRSSIRPEPLEADISKRCSQVVTLSSSSLATAASAGLFHCNAQLLSYRDWQNYTWLISPRSQGPKKLVVSFRNWINEWKCTGIEVTTHHSLAVCEISVWILQTLCWMLDIVCSWNTTNSLTSWCYSVLTQHLTFEWKWLLGRKLACAWLHLCMCVAPWSQRVNEGQWVQGEERMGVKVLEDCVIKAHKTASLAGSRKVCCWFSPSPPCWPPVKGFISQVSGERLPSSGNLLLSLTQWEASRGEGEERGYTYCMVRKPEAITLVFLFCHMGLWLPVQGRL